MPVQVSLLQYRMFSSHRLFRILLRSILPKLPLLFKTLEALQSLLPESDFFRANRQFIIARRAVREIAVWFGSRLTLHLTLETPERIVISKARVPEFKAWLTSAHPAG